MAEILKSVLRYPGGKTRALNRILSFIPQDFNEFREPFVGGGSVFLNVKQKINNQAVYKINDLNYDLYCFWTYAQRKNYELAAEIKKIKSEGFDGRQLFNNYIKNNNDYNDFERAVRFFILNRITFSGTVESGGYSQQAFEKRFTASSIERIKKLADILKDVEVRYGDYEELLFEAGEKVFIFLDPPYLTQSKSRLYGTKGDLHTSFDHERFADNMKKCPHRWLITLDDSPEIRKMFSYANIYEWKLQYGMNNYKKENAQEGKELFAANYKIS